MAAASSDCVDWWGMRETVDIVETLACVGETRLCVRLGGADKGGGVTGCANPAGGNWNVEDGCEEKVQSCVVL